MPEIPPVPTSMPLRAPQRWFKCIDYAPGLRIELPFAGEDLALAAALAHVVAGDVGAVKVGYYGFRSRVIVYGHNELIDLASV